MTMVVLHTASFRSSWADRMLEWTMEDIIQVSAQRQCSVRVACHLPGCRVCPASETLTQSVFPIGNTYLRFSSQEVAPFFIHNGFLKDCMLPVPTTLSSSELVVLVPKRGWGHGKDLSGRYMMAAAWAFGLHITQD